MDISNHVEQFFKFFIWFWKQQFCSTFIGGLVTAIFLEITRITYLMTIVSTP